MSSQYGGHSIKGSQSILDAPARTIQGKWGGRNPRFLGYEQSFLDALSGRFEVSTGTPEAEVLNDVIYMPQYSCLYSSDGLRMDSSCSYMGPERRLDTIATHIVDPPDALGPPVSPPDKIRLPKQLRELSERFIYAGNFDEHYGHFLTRTIARLWYAVKVQEPLVLWHGLSDGNGLRKTPFIDLFFESGLLDRNRFVSFREPVFLKEVVIPHPSFSINCEGFEAHKLLPEVVARYWLPREMETTSQPLYFSRRHLDQRLIINEAELEEELLKSGFAIVPPEELSLNEQIHLVNKHEVIVGGEGSALHSVLFDMSPRRNMVCLGRQEGGFRTTFLIIDAIKKVTCLSSSDHRFLENGLLRARC